MNPDQSESFIPAERSPGQTSAHVRSAIRPAPPLFRFSSLLRTVQQDVDTHLAHAPATPSAAAIATICRSQWQSALERTGIVDPATDTHSAQLTTYVTQRSAIREGFTALAAATPPSPPRSYRDVARPTPPQPRAVSSSRSSRAQQQQKIRLCELRARLVPQLVQRIAKVLSPRECAIRLDTIRGVCRSDYLATLRRAKLKDSNSGRSWQAMAAQVATILRTKGVSITSDPPPVSSPTPSASPTPPADSSPSARWSPCRPASRSDRDSLEPRKLLLWGVPPALPISDVIARCNQHVPALLTSIERVHRVDTNGHARIELLYTSPSAQETAFACTGLTKAAFGWILKKGRTWIRRDQERRRTQRRPKPHRPAPQPAHPKESLGFISPNPFAPLAPRELFDPPPPPTPGDPPTPNAPLDPPPPTAPNAPSDPPQPPPSSDGPGLIIGCWNVQGLVTKLHEVVEYSRRHHIQVLGVTETWEDVSAPIWEAPGYRWYGTPRDTTSDSRGGVGFLVQQSIAEQVVPLPPCATDGLSCLKIITMGAPLFLCLVYGCQEKSNSARCSQLYTELEERVSEYSALGDVMLLGDFNAKIGAGTHPNDLVGPFNPPEVSPHGKVLLRFMHTHNLVALNGRKASCPGITRRRDDERSAIDFMIVPAHQLANIAQFHIWDTADIGSDHYLLSAKLRTSVRKRRQQRRGKPRWRVERLRNRETSEATITQYHEALAAPLLQWSEFMDATLTSSPNLSEVITPAVAHLQQAIEDAASQAIGKTRSTRKAKYWWDAEIAAVVADRRAMYQQALASNSPEIWAEYKVLRAKVKRLARTKLMDAQRDLKAKLDSDLLNDIKLFWKFAQSHIGSSLDSPTGPPVALARPDGSVTDHPDEMAVLLRNHYAALGDASGNSPFFDPAHKECIETEVRHIAEDQPYSTACPDSLQAKIRVEEVRRALKTLQNGKSGGPDGLVNELLKQGGPMLEQGLTEVFNLVWRSTTPPDSWWTGITVSLFKKGDRLDPNNYRGITLLNVLGKLFCRILNTRLKAVITLQEEQGGFRDHRGTEDPLFVLTDLMAKKKVTGQPLFLAFLDIQKAYDRVWRPGLWKKLWDKGIRGRMWHMLRALYGKVSNQAVAGGAVSASYELALGLKQGCVLSPLLFNVFIDDLIVEVKALKLGVSVGNVHVSLLLFADDIVLLAESEADLQRSLAAVESWCRRWRLELNASKSEVMVVNGALAGTITCAGQPLKLVSQFRYLGLVLNDECDWSATIDHALTKAKKASHRLSRLLRLQILSVQTRLLLWNSLVRPILEYGAAIWWADKKQLKALESVQLSALRIILDCKVGVDALAIRAELGSHTLQSRLDSYVLKYVGRIACMPSHRLVKQTAASPPPVTTARRRGWRKVCDSLLQQYGLTEGLSELHGKLAELDSPASFPLPLYKEWKQTVKEAVVTTENTAFRTQCAAKGFGKGKLGHYHKIKKTISREDYLNDTNHWASVKLKFLLRSGSLSLEVETGRRSRRDRADRVCRVCDSGEVEDELHFIFRCISLKDVQCGLWDALRAVLVGGRGCRGCPWEWFLGLGESDRLLVLLGGPGPDWGGDALAGVDLVFRRWLPAAWAERCRRRAARCGQGPLVGPPESMDPGRSLAQ